VRKVDDFLFTNVNKINSLYSPPISEESMFHLSGLWRVTGRVAHYVSDILRPEVGTFTSIIMIKLLIIYN